MFGISFSEIVVIAVIALIVVGPQKLPSLLRSFGQQLGRLRRLTTEVRAQTGIDEILREEGIDGVRELRALLRGEVNAARAREHDPYDDEVELDLTQEYPAEGVDAQGALPDDLVDALTDEAPSPAAGVQAQPAAAAGVQARPAALPPPSAAPPHAPPTTEGPASGTPRKESDS